MLEDRRWVIGAAVDIEGFVVWLSVREMYHSYNAYQRLHFSLTRGHQIKHI